jgi:hypothetical protein
MRRRVLLRRATALGLAGLAGCTGNSPDSSGETTTTTTTAATTESTTTTTNTTSAASRPSGFSTDGVSDAQTVVAEHKNAVLSLPNYTGTWTLRSVNEDGSTDGEPTEASVRANPETEVVHLTYTDHANDVEVYYDGTFYEYHPSDDTVLEGESERLFTNVEKSFEPLASFAVNILLAPTLGAADWTAAGTVDVRGEAGFAYDAAAVSEQRQSQYEDVTYTGVSGELVVGADGGIARLAYEPEFESASTSLQTVSFRLEGVGETTVERPGWLD